MSARPLTARIALWLALCALLLKGAVPMLASVAAQAQGKAVAEVCTAYGVALPGSRAWTDATALVPSADRPLAGPARHAGSDEPQAPLQHARDHCALGALVAAPWPHAPASLRAPAVHGAERVAAAEATADAPDAAARWAARLHHAPPARS